MRVEDTGTHFVVTFQALTIVRESLEPEVPAARPSSPALVNHEEVPVQSPVPTKYVCDRAPTIVRESLEVEVEDHKTVVITADVEGQAAGNLIFSSEALRLSVVLASRPWWMTTAPPRSTSGTAA
ncbi:hypothetical protein BDZ88DRAFT_447946 [Geranomyces variabilis]|nr:hypothetical protein BDZ88DRAFT_447946 [Geranomyces variabilis]KAJ3141760.1 hypothetical protein HDU90_006103 [Geranomyces variabilis]